MSTQGPNVSPSSWISHSLVLCHPHPQPGSANCNPRAVTLLPCSLERSQMRLTELRAGGGGGEGSLGSQGNTCHCCHWLEASVPSCCFDGFGCEHSPYKGGSHRLQPWSLPARVSGNWGEMDRTRVGPKTELDRRFPLLGNLSVCSRGLQNKDLHMVILARTGRFRLSFSTPWKWPPKMCTLKEHLF